MSSPPSIAILGGVGAIASARFHLDFVESWAKTHNAKTDDDFPKIVHVSCSLGLTAEGMVDVALSASKLKGAIDHLAPGCDRYALICNSVSPLLSGTPRVLTPVEACRESLSNVKRAWLLASDSTIRDQIYQRAYPHINWKIPKTSMTLLIQQSICQGRFSHSSLDITDQDPIVLGCTELSTCHLNWANTISPTDEMIKILCSINL